MEFSDIKVQLLAEPRDSLRAYVNLTIDECLVLRDIKVIEGSKGLFVAMPSQEITRSCERCRGTNPVRARFCSHCAQPPSDYPRQMLNGRRPRPYTDVVHPINRTGRELFESTILTAYQREREQSLAPGYVPKSFVGLDHG